MNLATLKEGELVARNGILKLLLLGSIKLTAGLITGMTVIFADAISTFADTLGLFASYFGLRLSRKSADKNFKYGYYKFETLMALLVSIGIIYLGYVIFTNSVEAIYSPTEGSFRSFAITTTIISIILSYKLYKKFKETAEKVNSLSLLANAKDKKMDVFSGIAVMVSIIANYQGIPYIEGIISIFISILILKEGILSTKESLFFLLDYWDDPTLNRKIRKILASDKGLVLKIKKLRLRRAGTFIFGEAFLEINPFAAVQDLRDELEVLQDKVKEINPYIKDFAIFTHISKKDKVKIAIPIKEGKTLDATLASNLKSTKRYLFVILDRGKIQNYYTRELQTEQKKTINLINFLKKEKPNILIDNKLNSLVFYNLRRTNHILVYPNLSDLKKVRQTLDLLVIDT